MTTDTASAQRTHQMSQGAEAEKVDGLVGDLETSVARLLCFDPGTCLPEARLSQGRIGLDPAFIDHSPYELFEQIIHPLGVAFARVLPPAVEQVLWDAPRLYELLHDGAAQGVHVARVRCILEAVAEPALEEEVRQRVEKILQAQTVQRGWNVFRVGNLCHSSDVQYDRVGNQFKGFLKRFGSTS